MYRRCMYTDSGRQISRISAVWQLDPYRGHWRGLIQRYAAFAE